MGVVLLTVLQMVHELTMEQLASLQQCSEWSISSTNSTRNGQDLWTIAKQAEKIELPSHITDGLTFWKEQSASTDTKARGPKTITPQSESVSEEDSDPEQAQRDKEMQQNLALLAKVLHERIYKPTKTTFELIKLQDKTEVTKPRMQEAKGVKDSRITEKMMCAQQAETRCSLQAEQADWLADHDEEINEQELEAHYSFMAKIQEVSLEESSSMAAIGNRRMIAMSLLIYQFIVLMINQVDQNAARMCCGRAALASTL
ncbi:hypothetical protein Tco_1274646 [Tanacetum coccineum]